MPLRVICAPHRLALVLLAALALTGCEWDVGYDLYKNRTAAAIRIEHGSLPDVFPPSAKLIRLRTDYDLKYNAGRFLVAIADVAPLLARLRPGLPTRHPYPIDDENWNSLSSGGFTAGMLDGTDGTADPGASTAMQWVVSCHRSSGQCRYYGWPKSSPFID